MAIAFIAIWIAIDNDEGKSIREKRRKNDFFF